MPVRMKDIARDLGVSVVTVSKVLHNHTDIGEQTRLRVLERVKELNYQPNFAARALITGRTYLVGLVVPDLLHPFFAEVAKALSKALRKAGYSLIISSSDEDQALERQEIEHLVARRLDAIIVASTGFDPDVFRQAEQQRIPYILIDRHFPGLRANFVGTDDKAVGRLATEHLISVGCTRIAYIGSVKISTGAERLRGYEQALLKHRLPAHPDYISVQSTVDVDTRQSGAEAMRRLLALEFPPDGVFCLNDPIAMGAMDEILQSGLRLPEDVALIGCGNLHYDSSLRVPLSSIDQHSATLGRRAALMALKLIEAKKPPRARRIIIQPEVVVRASTQKHRPE